MSRRKICFVTGSRADFGLLEPVLRAVSEEPEFRLQVVAAAMHLCPEFGMTAKAIEAAGFSIDRNVEMVLAGDTPVSVTKSMGLGLIGFADVFADLAPNLLVLLGDRYEIMCAALAALAARIPVAHIAGGDVTEGAMDEAIRHSITKMAHVHFSTNEVSARRIVQLGEDPKRVFNVGSPGIDALLAVPTMTRDELSESLGFKLRRTNLLVTFHPETLAPDFGQGQFRELLAALDGLGPDMGLILTRTTADAGGREINRMAEEFCAGRNNAALFDSLGQLRYVNAVRHADAVAGNSSSGLYEAPALKTPAVNIGDRQKGRLKPGSVIDCPPVREAIAEAIAKALTLDCSHFPNPYGDGKAAARIVRELKRIPDFTVLVKKSFHDLTGDAA